MASARSQRVAECLAAHHQLFVGVMMVVMLLFAEGCDPASCGG
jgi:hypothetical protein